MSRNSRVFTTFKNTDDTLAGSTWGEIHVCLQHCLWTHTSTLGSTWVEIHVCLQHKMKTVKTISRSTWVEIHVCLQLTLSTNSSGDDLHE